LIGAVTASLGAERDVRFWGNERISDDQLRRLTRGAQNGEMLGLVQEAYIESGYLFAKIQIEEGTLGDGVVLIIEEGDPARFGRVQVTGAERFDENEVRGMLGAREGQLFRPMALKRRIETLLEQYDAQGFPFVQVWMDSLELDRTRQRVNLNVFVVEGGSKQLARIEVDGLEKTREDIAIRLSGLKEGERYDGDKIRDAHLRLKSSGIFDDVSYPTIRLSPEGQGVEARIQVIEPNRNNTFSFALGYAEREATQKRVLSGVVRLDLVNIGGSLRDFHLFWSNDGADRSDTKITYHQRFLFGRQLAFGASLEQVGLDTLYTWQSLGVEAGLPVGRVFGGLLGLDLAVNGDRNTFSTGNVSKTLRLRLAGGISYVRGRERRGTFFELRTSGAHAIKDIEQRESGLDQSVSQLIVELQARYAVSLFTNLHFSNKTTFRSLDSDEAVIPLSEQFYVGGASTLRGYRENQFHGRRAAHAQSELLIGKSRLENGYVFVDLGYIVNEVLLPSDFVLQERTFRVGYGFGLRTQSTVGNIDISFGVGEELSLQQTKIHVILNRSF
jgi:outer membrane protein insertion porin family